MSSQEGNKEEKLTRKEEEGEERCQRRVNSNELSAVERNLKAGSRRIHTVILFG